LKAVDTSVVVAAFASWHQEHAAARRVLDDRPSLIGHCALETLSVLTRLPAPHRVGPELVATFLSARFPDPPLVLPAESLRALPEELARLGIAGGAVYDALVATTARHHGTTLVTLDLRAASTYRQVGVGFAHP
jgi:predicted nucleic acid-binding protein